MNVTTTGSVKTQKLEPSSWKRYFGDLASQIEGRRAFIELASLRAGGQVEEE